MKDCCSLKLDRRQHLQCPRTFPRIGIFRHDLDSTNRASREDGLIGPMIDTNATVNNSRKNVKVRSKTAGMKEIIRIV
jgi:hypothetical protein